ncbi:MAG TPA: metallopeptidase family protein [Candidatus Paceibacterota bacterium]|nr:metallopeptidase family protein [Candidatus Paceibacterota bacterium]HOK97216.1 metallopeptidase family protein [Candidatus Paceibacterota bacterium]HPP64593.1 metallopeptidase family protein [Candidatus Paceibacterota bacterium]
MKKEMFENLVSQMTKELPKEFLKKLKNVAILIQDFPDEYQLKQGGYSENKCLLGLYEGVPQIQRGYYNRALPDKITLFQKNIESIANNDPEAIKEIIKNTLWHEIGHHFGFTDEELNNKLKIKDKK